jgi:hypothetical protein
MQFFDHPKVFSIPLGPVNKDEIANILRTTPNMTNRTNLLFMSNSDSETRLPITGVGKILAHWIKDGRAPSDVDITAMDAT